MAKGKTQTYTPGGNGDRPEGQLDFEAQLYVAADKLRGRLSLDYSKAAQTNTSSIGSH
jgi:hypothetical protein